MSSNAGAINAGKAVYKLGLDKKEMDHGLAGAVKQVQALGASMAAAGATIAAAGLAMVAPLKKGIDQFSAFEKPMARVRALTNATDGQFQALSSKARQLGRDTVFMASDAANAMAFFSLAGFKVNETLDAVGPTLDLAAVGMMDVAQAADIVAKVMRGMDQPTSQTGYVVDVLSKAMTTANTDLIQLGDALKYVGPIATSAGWGLEETVAAIQTLSDSGIQSTMAGTSLRGMFLTLLKPTGRAAEEIKKLGVTVLDTKGKVRPLAEVIGDFSKALDGLEPGARMQALGKIFSKREAAGAAVLVRRGGDALAARADALRETGAAARIAAIQLNTVWGAVKLLESSVEALGIEIGAALMPAIRVLTYHAVGWINAASEWVQKNPTAIMSFAALGAAILGVGSALTATGVAIVAVTAVGGSLASAAGTAWALSWNHWVMGVSKGLVLLSEIPAAEKALHSFFHEVAHRAEKAAHTVTDAWHGMISAIDSGDLTGAGEIGILGLKTAWLEATGDIRAAWIELTSFISEKWTMATAPVMSFVHELLDSIIELGGHIADVGKQFKDWTSFTDAMGFTRTSYRFKGTKPEESVDDYIKRRYPNAKPGGAGWAQDRNAFADNASDPEWLRKLNKQLREGRENREKLLDEARAAAGKSREELEAALNKQKQNKAMREAWPFLNAGIGAVIGGGSPAGPTGSMDQWLNKEARKHEVSGTFSTAVANQIGGKTLAEKQLDEQRKANKKLDGVIDAIGDLDIDAEFQ